MLSLRQAAEKTGIDKMTISRAIKSGKLSANRESKTGPFKIDPAELARVFSLEKKKAVANTSQKDSVIHKETSDISLKIRLLEREVELRDKQIELLETGKRQDRQHYQEALDDIRTRLDGETEERRRLTLMLTDQRIRKKKWSLFG